MSQHDFEIANQGFPSFRSDLNSGLQALASNSAGATEPSSTYAYQFWYDETTDLLKLRNSDDDAWITLAAFDQTNDEWEIRSAVIQAVDSAGVVIKTDDGVARISVADGGTVTIGTVDINGGTIDGVTIGGASAGAVTATTITGSGDMNIDSGTLFVDASETRVGIGTGSPEYLVHARGGSGFNYRNLAWFQGGGTNAASQFERAVALGASQDGAHVDGWNGTSGSRGGASLLLQSAGGKVGIGNAIPPKLLTVGGDPEGTFTQGFTSEDGVQVSSADSTSQRNHYIFRNPNGAVGTIKTTSSSTSFNTSSDYRLKENVVDMTGAIDRLKQLPVHQFNFIADPDKTVDGFLAHEAQDIVPEAVTGEKDAVEAIGNVTDAEGVIVQEGVTEPTELPEGQAWTKTGDRPVMQGIDQSKLVPLLTGALKEAIAKIEALEARVSALES